MSSAAAQVRTLVEPVVTSAGLDLEDVVVRATGSQRLVQLLVDRDGGIDLDAVAAVSRACSDALDEVELFGGAYDLEVSSPGVDRPLTEPRHWRRNTGRLVQVRQRDGKDITGRIARTDADGITLSVGKTERTMAYGDLVRGVVQVEFTPSPGAQPGSGDTSDDSGDSGDIDDIDDIEGDDEEAER
ncbi:MAG: ribosome maturation factor RimP [Mycobacteriales bacterium]